MGIVITTFIGFALVTVSLGYALNQHNLFKEYYEESHLSIVSRDKKCETLTKQLESLGERYKELMTDEVYWFSKYKLATEKKISRAKFTGTNKDYTKYCKSFEEEIKSYKETVTKYEEDHKKVTNCIVFPGLHIELEISGTKLQKELFEKKRKAEVKMLSPEETIKLAVGCGCSVSEIKKYK